MNALVAFVLAAGLGVLPAWQNLGPGGGGWIQSICASPHDPDRLYLGTGGNGVFVGRVKQNHTFEAVDLGLNSP